MSKDLTNPADHVNMDDMTSETDNSYAEALARAAAYTDEVGLSDGTDRPAAVLTEVARPGTCPRCGGEDLVELGRLGRRQSFRCRACGAEVDTGELGQRPKVVR